MEVGYVLLNKIVRIFTSNAQWILVIVAFTTCYPVSQATPMIHIYKCFDVGRKKNVVKRATSLQVYDLFMTGQIENRDNLWHTKNAYVEPLCSES